jgi:hypothetical protein
MQCSCEKSGGTCPMSLVGKRNCGIYVVTEIWKFQQLNYLTKINRSGGTTLESYNDFIS